MREIRVVDPAIAVYLLNSAVQWEHQDRHRPLGVESVDDPAIELLRQRLNDSQSLARYARSLR